MRCVRSLAVISLTEERFPITEEDLIIICMDLFSAGAESTSNTIEFIIMYMILYPGVQKKLHDELDQVLERSRRPNLDDKNQYVYYYVISSKNVFYFLLLFQLLSANPILRYKACTFFKMR